VIILKKTQIVVAEVLNAGYVTSSDPQARLCRHLFVSGEKGLHAQCLQRERPKFLQNVSSENNELSE
jgi:hypothetical protein